MKMKISKVKLLNKKYILLITLLDGHTILEIGCGDGTNAAAILLRK
jgi:cyclopropane fatty-acyl-phospholipid synthase-like methyltransferase